MFLTMHTPLKQNIEFLAARLGITTQPGMEERTNVPQTTISGIINQGKMPRLSTLEKLAGGLNVELWQLLAPHALLKVSIEQSFVSLITDYSQSSAEGRRKISLVAEAQAVLADVDR